MTEFAGRREDHRLVSGAGRYTADWSLPGQVHAAFLRSDVAHARIESLDAAAARAAPGVLAVLTGADMDAAGFMRSAPRLSVEGPRGPLKAPHKPALAADRVRFVGEPVAVVIAETESQARDAAELIELELDMLEVVADPEAALAEGAPETHDEVPGNLAFEFVFGDAAATEAAFAAAAHVARIELDSPRVVANPMEPKAALTAWQDGALDLWCPSQGMTGIRDAVARATSLPAEAVRVHAEDVGGAFGVRGDAYPEYIALALAARQLGRPVKWVGTRSETFVSDMQGRAIRMTAELALDAEGRFLGIRHGWLCDLGAHPSGAGPLTGVMNPATMACGAYRIPAVFGRVRQALTNRVPITAYRGAGRPEMAYVVERLVDAAARTSGIDRIALRRRNRIPAEAFPYPVATAVSPVAYDSADFDRLMDRALAAAEWDGFPARRDAAAARGRLRGIGCALFIEPAGGVAPTDQAAITFPEGGGIHLHQVAQASGQSYETVFPDLVAGVFEIDPGRVTLQFAGPDSPAQKGGGAFGSRSLMSQGSVLDEAARQVLVTARRLAAQTLAAAADDLVFHGGAFQVPGSNRFVDLAELARAHPGGLDTVAELPSPRAFPSGMHVAEVEIDPDTGETELVAYTAVDDCGTVVNETLVLGQIWGGLYQGLGQVFGEACAYDADGQLVSGSFMEYPMPRSELMRRVSIAFAGVPSPSNRLGAKGVGESGTVGALPTAMNAVLDALAPAGITAFDMPATPHRIWHALQPAA